MKNNFIFLLACVCLLLCSPIAQADNTEPSSITAVQPPCPLPAPANLQHTQPNAYTVHFTWDTVPGAVGYRSVLINTSTGAQQTMSAAPDNSTFSVIPGDTYYFAVAAMCSITPPLVSPEVSEVTFTAETIIIDLIVANEGCSPSNQASDSNSDPNIWGYNWVQDQDYYIELTRIEPKEFIPIKKIRLAFRRTAQGFQLGELNGDDGNGNLCGQAVSLPPGNCTAPPVDAYNAKVTFGGRTCRMSFPSMAEIYYYANTNTLPPEVPFNSFVIYRTCVREGGGGHDGGGGTGHRSDQTPDAPGNSELQVAAVNPFSEQLTLHFATTPDGPVKTRLYDLQGIPKIETLIQPGQMDENVYSIPTDALPAGMYFLMMETAQGQVIVQKVLKI